MKHAVLSKLWPNDRLRQCKDTKRRTLPFVEDAESRTHICTLSRVRKCGGTFMQAAFSLHLKTVIAMCIEFYTLVLTLIITSNPFCVFVVIAE